MPLLARLLLFTVALGGHSVLGVAIVNRTHAYGWNRKLVDVLTIAIGLALVLGVWPLAQFAAADHYPSNWPHLPHAIVTGYGWTAVATALIAALHNLWRRLHPERRGGVESRRTTPIDLQATPDEMLIPGVVRTLGTLPGNEVLRPQLLELEIRLPDLPVAFDGFTIAHWSDLHMSGRITRAYFDRVVEISNSLAPDMVAITGDIVERVECLDWIDESLARLQAKRAKLFVLGNHDTKSDPAETRRRLVAGGFVDIGRRVVQLHFDCGPCVAAGNEMPWFGPRPEITEQQSKSNQALRLALLHSPDHFGWAQEHGFHLALAGHNHGGQIRFPILGALLAPSIYGTRYSAGVFRHGGTTMHVSQGTCSLAVIRWNCPPQLVLLTLRSG